MNTSLLLRAFAAFLTALNWLQSAGFPNDSLFIKRASLLAGSIFLRNASEDCQAVATVDYCRFRLSLGILRTFLFLVDARAERVAFNSHALDVRWLPFRSGGSAYARFPPHILRILKATHNVDGALSSSSLSSAAVAKVAVFDGSNDSY